MNKLVELVLRANIVPANAVYQLERWGLIEQGSLERSRKSSAPMYDKIKILEDIGDVIEEDLTKLKETKLDIVLQDPELLFLRGRKIPAYIDEMGRFVVSPSEKPGLVPGCVLGSIKGKRYTLLNVEELYSGDSVIALILITREDNDALL